MNHTVTIRTAANGRPYCIKRNAEGQKFLHVMAVGRYLKVTVPLEMAGLAAGKDAWMRDCTAMCKGCKALTPIRELHGESDLPGHCVKCAETYFHCAKCNGNHHPDDECPSVAETAVAK